MSNVPFFDRPHVPISDSENRARGAIYALSISLTLLPEHIDIDL